jgi:uncharacterized protein YdhG (YjbR/CyaY superfamily)
MAPMAETKPAKGKQKASETFTAEEKEAMREAAKERRKGGRGKTGEADLLEKIAEMPDGERAMAERLHALITENAPDLAPKTWYGMPAYAKDGDVVVFFQSAAKFKSRYATLGFSDKAKLDKGAMWPSSYALKELTKTAEKEIAALVKRAVA